ncbi:LysR family transcriptional regulator [Massilia sp. BSC265]|uniref:LysR family transcriptional regulator n=1 Tax=Massilia sp. BSC265 TaxID=1549812 RepID=UPI0004E8F56A|nr:LysR family transcriptional regulator [Massilia sp. BSC265]KFI08523.1 LysR family transcriptional regulator [Massilia sp. BSC265]
MLERIHLTILREVERRGSLTAAADSLHLTQSALSHAIRKLEQGLGVEVWTRDGRSLRPTPAGLYLLDLARRLLPQFEHAERLMAQVAEGQRGTLRIGMECHPCYQWLLKVVAPYLAAWPDVDVDVKQRFQFGGIKALEEWEIDVLVTPDPLHKAGLRFVPVFDYEQVLVVGSSHRLAGREYVDPSDLLDEVLITYPVDIDRLDIYKAFFLPAGCAPRQRKTIETTDILLQMVASGRGVAALPRWLVQEYAARMPVLPVRLGPAGIPKQIFLGTREDDARIDYLDAFIRLAASIGDNP